MARATSTNFRNHITLARNVIAAGVDFKLNPPECDERKVFGWYKGYDKELVVCQENKKPGSSAEVAWTAEDLDTLRHEAHHLVQDCMIGDNHDMALGPVYQEPLAVAKAELTGRTIDWILNTGYADASDWVKLLELEAFAVAAMNQPLEQVKDIQRYCF
tara:strand:- start:368 stop:844 length:477 start_codon:yes stop_codon:yes gene_type:complete